MGGGQGKAATAPVVAAERPTFNSPIKEIKNTSVDPPVVYKVQSSLGKGAFGEVFKVTDPAGKKWALKQIYCESKAVHDRSLVETQTMKALRHPNVVQLNDCFTLHDPTTGSYALCIVMELVEGTDLETYLQRSVGEKPKLEIVMEWFICLLDALVYFQKQNLLHRDLKPANILISKQGFVKISDFGVSKIVAEGQMGRTICGTICYMAPEVLSGKMYDAKCDIWSLGCILYEVATGIPTKDIFLNLRASTDFFQTIKDKSVQVIVSMMLQIDPANRPTAAKLQQEDIVKGWAAITADKFNVDDVPVPPTRSFLLAFISSLQSENPLFRSRGIQYLRRHSKISDVRKCILSVSGVELLCSAFDELNQKLLDPTNPQALLTLVAAPEVVTLLGTLLQTYHSRETIFQLRSGGGIKKLMTCFRESSIVVQAMADLIAGFFSVLVLDSVGYRYVEEQGLEPLLGSWFEMNSPSDLQSAVTIYAHLPIVHDDYILANFLTTIQKLDPGVIYDNFRSFCCSKIDGSLLVNESNANLFSGIINRLMLMDTLKNAPEKSNEFLSCVYGLVESTEQLEKAASAGNLCSFFVTGKMFNAKFSYCCRQCFKADNLCVCLACSRQCHKGHSHVKNEPQIHQSYCDCFERRKCSAIANPSNLEYLTVDFVPPKLSMNQVMQTFFHSLILREITFCQPANTMATAMICSFTLSESKRNLATQFYAEVTILDEISRTPFAVGVCKPQAKEPKNFLPGLFPESYALHSLNGKVYTNKIGKGVLKKACAPQLGVSHTIGVGVVGNGAIYFTVDGYYLGEMFEPGTLSPNSLQNLCIGSCQPGLRVKYRFQPPFLFNHEEMKQVAASLSPRINKTALRCISNANFLRYVLSYASKIDVAMSLLLPILTEDVSLATQIEPTLTAKLHTILNATSASEASPMAQRKAKKILALMNAPVLPTPPPAALAPPERNFLLESGLHNFQQLTAMGFSGEKSLAALQHARNNLQSAVDILTDETPSSDPELPPAPPAPVTPPTPSAPLYHQYPSPITQPPKITPRPPTHQNPLPSPPPVSFNNTPAPTAFNNTPTPSPFNNTPTPPFNPPTQARPRSPPSKTTQPLPANFFPPPQVLQQQQGNPLPSPGSFVLPPMTVPVSISGRVIDSPLVMKAVTPTTPYVDREIGLTFIVEGRTTNSGEMRCSINPNWATVISLKNTILQELGATTHQITKLEKASPVPGQSRVLIQSDVHVKSLKQGDCVYAQIPTLF